jgi:hypothetical protein
MATALGPIPLTGGAIDGILERAQSQGLRVTSGKTDVTENSADPGYVLGYVMSDR